jgi:hypothetical protein
MAFPCPETPIKVRRLARTSFHRRLDHLERLAKTDGKLRRDHVVFERLASPTGIRALGQLENKIPFGNKLGVSMRSRNRVGIKECFNDT